MVNGLVNTLGGLRRANELMIASDGEHYQWYWIRDNYYEIKPYLTLNPEWYKRTYQTMLDVFIKTQEKHKKFYHLIVNPDNKAAFEFPHPRCDFNLEEIPRPWGNKQLDTFGELLYGIWEGESAGIRIIRGDKDRWIIRLIIEFLQAIKYWDCPDNGIWEEAEEVHASSIGACVAGLTAARLLDFDVPQWLIDKGHETLNRLGTRESLTKDVDLAQITLIYPFNILPTDRGRQVLKNIEDNLVRDMGAIRYVKDMYYNIANSENIEYGRYYDPTAEVLGGEMQWTFGFSFLALAYETYGEYEKAEYYKNLVVKTIHNNKIAEGHYAKVLIPNDNDPLGWSLAMAILALK